MFLLGRSITQRPLCSPRLLSYRASVYYSQSATGRIHPEAFVSTSLDAGTLTTTSSNSHCAVADTGNPLDPTRLDRYFASIEAADLEPTLDDIERCKPESFSPPDSSRYVVEYTSVLEALCRSFSKDQLRHFTELYKLDAIWTRSSRRKIEYAESIIEKAWGWPSLKEIERKRRDTTEVLVKSFTVTPSQLFLLMGRDGADMLQLSMQYNVHVSLTSSPLALRAVGLRGSLKKLAEYISSLKKGIIDEIFELPTGCPIRPDLLQRISRLAGAYVENHGHRGKVRVCAKSLSDVVSAKQLALRASLEVGTQARTVCFDLPNKTKDTPVAISEPRRYSIYPFVAPSSFPWTMHSGSALRLRRVTDWLGVDSSENIVSTGGLADNSDRLLNLDQSKEDLRHLVRPATFGSASYRQRIITASLGHILMSSGDNSQRTAIFSPLKGTLSLPDILKWVEASGIPLTFVPSVPPAMVTVTIGKRRNFHRLIYKTLPQTAGQVSKLPQHVLKFEMELFNSLPTSTQPIQDLEHGLRLNDTPLSDKANFRCQVGKETYINLMLPDRPMDVQLCVFDWDGVTLMQQPQVLREYAGKFSSFSTKARLSQPEPPSTFSYEGKAYYLQDSLNARQSINLDLLSTITSDCDASNLTEVCNESIVDLQSNQKTELYQVKFDGSADGPSWRCFLSACDQLSVLPLQSGSKKDELQPSHLER